MRNIKTRETWIENTLKQIPPGSRILDAGAGELQYKRFCHHLEYVSQDFGLYDGTGNGAGLHVGTWDQSKLDIVSDIGAIPEEDASFDAIMCIEVLEHLQVPLQALKEFSRLLRSGGHLIITSPFCSLTHFAPYHFCSGFNRYYYATHLPSLGFEIMEIEPNGNFFEYLAQEVRRLPAVASRYAAVGKRWWWLHGLMYPLLVALDVLSRRDSGSSELLCFGFHVRAVKRGDVS